MSEDRPILTGLFGTLTPEQQTLVLNYNGPENIGPPKVRLISITVGPEAYDTKALAPMIARIVAGIESDRQAGRLSEVPPDAE